MDDTKPVSISVNDASIPDFLAQVLQGQSLGYTIKKKTIVIKKIFVSPQLSGGQDKTKAPPITVKGRVVDEEGKPVEGSNGDN